MDHSSTPLLSLIIPLYNTESYIDKCLTSIVDNDEDKTRYEVIVINDGSTDSSPELVRSFCDNYPNVFLYSQENQGVSVARMNGVAKAKGEYIWFIDSDDYISADAVSELLSDINHHPDIDVFVPPMFLFYEDIRPGFATHTLKERYVISGKDLLQRKDFFLVGPPQFITRRSLFANDWLCFPRGIRYEDEYFSRVLKYIANRFMILERPLYFYRQWNGSHMNSVRMEGANDVIAVYKHLDLFMNQSVLPEDESWFRYNIVSFLLESYTRNLSFVDTAEFQSFREENGSFIFREFVRYRKCFPLKDRVLAFILLHSPRTYSRVTPLTRRIKRLVA